MHWLLTSVEHLGCVCDARPPLERKIRNVSRVIGIAAAAKDEDDDRMTVSLVNKLAVALDEQEICIRVIADHIGAISEANCLVLLEIPPRDGRPSQSRLGSQPTCNTVYE